MSFEDIERSDRGDGFDSKIFDELGSFLGSGWATGGGSGFEDSGGDGFEGETDGFVFDGLEGVEEVGGRRGEGRVEEEGFLETEGWKGGRDATMERRARGRESERERKRECQLEGSLSPKSDGGREQR